MKKLNDKQQRLQGRLLEAYRRRLESAAKDPYGKYDFNDLVEDGLFALGGETWFNCAMGIYSLSVVAGFDSMSATAAKIITKIVAASAEECKRIASEYKWTGKEE